MRVSTMYTVTKRVTPVTVGQRTTEGRAEEHGAKGPRDPGLPGRLTEGNKWNEVLAVTGFFIIWK